MKSAEFVRKLEEMGWIFCAAHGSGYFVYVHPAAGLLLRHRTNSAACIQKVQHFVPWHQSVYWTCVGDSKGVLERIGEKVAEVLDSA